MLAFTAIVAEPRGATEYDGRADSDEEIYRRKAERAAS